MIRLFRILLDPAATEGGAENGAGTTTPTRSAGNDPVALLTGQVGQLTSERDTWKGKAEKALADLAKLPGEQTARVKELERKIRERDHKDVFRDEARKAGVRDDAVEALYTLSKYDPGDKDQADAASIAELIGGTKETHPYLFGEVRAADAGETTSQAARPLGEGRGKAAPPGKLKVTKEQMADPKFCFENQAMIRKAQKEGTLIISER